MVIVTESNVNEAGSQSVVVLKPGKSISFPGGTLLLVGGDMQIQAAKKFAKYLKELGATVNII